MLNSTKRRRGALLAVSAALFLSSCSFTASRTMRVQRDVERDLERSGSVSLDVETRNGAVEIWTDPTVDHVQVKAHMRASAATSDEAQQRLEAMDVSVRVEPGGVIAVRPVMPGTWRSNESVSFEIVVPALAVADVETSNGRVTLAGATGRSRVVTGNGSITASDCHGGLDVDTSNAAVVVTGSSGDLRVDTSNGSVKVEGHDGLVDIGTSNGRIALSLAPGVSTPFTLRTSNGSIGVEITSAWSGTIAASTSNGRVTLKEGGSSERRGSSSVLELGRGGQRSTATSSNGSIAVKVRQISM